LAVKIFGLDIFLSAQGSAADFCEHGNETRIQ